MVLTYFACGFDGSSVVLQFPRNLLRLDIVISIPTDEDVLNWNNSHFMPPARVDLMFKGLEAWCADIGLQ
jgi:hypothetical protein